MLVFEDVDQVVGKDDECEFERVSFALTKGEFADKRYHVEFEVCPDPTCPCTLLHWVAQPDDNQDGDETYHFEVDVETRSLENRKDCDGASLRLAEAALAEITEEDWAELEDIFYTAKAELSDDFDIDEAGAVLDEEDDSVYPYAAVLPFAEPFLFMSDKGMEMVAFDSYDVKETLPRVYLTIYQADLEEDDMTEENAINIIVDYSQKALVEIAEKAEKQSPQKLLRSMENANFDFWDLLKRRHNNLRALSQKQN